MSTFIGKVSTVMERCWRGLCVFLCVCVRGVIQFRLIKCPVCSLVFCLKNIVFRTWIVHDFAIYSKRSSNLKSETFSQLILLCSGGKVILGFAISPGRDQEFKFKFNGLIDLFRLGWSRWLAGLAKLSNYIISTESVSERVSSWSWFRSGERLYPRRN